ncbi:unnamed protein product, partial [Scytosiphon promiscuus]
MRFVHTRSRISEILGKMLMASGCTGRMSARTFALQTQAAGAFSLGTRRTAQRHLPVFGARAHPCCAARPTSTSLRRVVGRRGTAGSRATPSTRRMSPPRPIMIEYGIWMKATQLATKGLRRVRTNSGLSCPLLLVPQLPRMRDLLHVRTAPTFKEDTRKRRSGSVGESFGVLRSGQLFPQRSRQARKFHSAAGSWR